MTPDNGPNEAPAPVETPAVAVVVAQPAPPDDDADDADDADEAAEIGRIAGQVAALETRITEAIEGERTWTTETITSLRQELADLKATLQQVTSNLPQTVAELREELTRLSQEIAAEQEARTATLAVVTEVPPHSPPDANNLPGGAEGPGTTASQPVASPSKRAKRVI